MEEQWDGTTLIAELGKCQNIDLSLSPDMAFSLIALLQLASRHPSMKGSRVWPRVEQLARNMQADLGQHSDYVDRLLEQGWHPVFDVRAGE